MFLLMVGALIAAAVAYFRFRWLGGEPEYGEIVSHADSDRWSDRSRFQVVPGLPVPARLSREEVAFVGTFYSPISWKLLCQVTGLTYTVPGDNGSAETVIPQVISYTQTPTGIEVVVVPPAMIPVSDLERAQQQLVQGVHGDSPIESEVIRQGLVIRLRSRDPLAGDIQHGYELAPPIPTYGEPGQQSTAAPGDLNAFLDDDFEDDTPSAPPSPKQQPPTTDTTPPPASPEQQTVEEPSIFGQLFQAPEAAAEVTEPVEQVERPARKPRQPRAPRGPRPPRPEKLG